jgi:hypothetical protein
VVLLDDGKVTGAGTVVVVVVVVLEVASSEVAAAPMMPTTPPSRSMASAINHTRAVLIPAPSS